MLEVECWNIFILKGVIELVDGKAGKEAKVVDARHDSSSRNIYRYPDLSQHVDVQKIPDHFIFSVESVGKEKSVLVPFFHMVLSYNAVYECEGVAPTQTVNTSNLHKNIFGRYFKYLINF